MNLVRDPDLRRRIGWFLGVLVLITASGTAGYMWVEGWGWIDAIYMTVITLSTVGFQEVRPLSEGGRLFTTGLIMAGVGSVAYLFGSLSEYIISGELKSILRTRHMQKRIDAKSGHYIICGYGRVGRQAAQDLACDGEEPVIIEREEPAGESISTEWPYLTGSGADDQVLIRAGVKRARGLVAAAGDDAENLFITLTAHNLNPDLVIVARANQPSTEPKLVQAGATHVISPYAISGRRIAAQLLHPNVTDFLDVVTRSGDLELWLEEMTLDPRSELTGETLRSVDLRSRVGVNVLAIRRRGDSRPIVNPSPETNLEPGSVLIVLGTRDQLAALSRLARHSGDGNPPARPNGATP